MRTRQLSPKRSAELQARAQEMRFAPTRSEEILWRQGLSGSKLGVAFRRQVVVGRFIVDFLAPSVRLVVEVDGGYHQSRARADARRDRALEKLGYRVLRLPAEVVVEHLPQTLTRIREQLG